MVDPSQANSNSWQGRFNIYPNIIPNTTQATTTQATTTQATTTQATTSYTSPLPHSRTRDQILADAFHAVDQQNGLSGLQLEARVLGVLQSSFPKVSKDRNIYGDISAYQQIGNLADQGKINGYQIAASKIGLISLKLFGDPVALYKYNPFQDLIKRRDEPKHYTMNLRKEITLKELAEFINEIMRYKFNLDKDEC